MVTSAVDFPTPSRVHVGLAVSDLVLSRQFYQHLLEMEPTKVRPGYVKFESHNPPINLTLNESGTPLKSRGSVTHFGIQVKSTAAVAAQTERLGGLGLKVRTEQSVTCCYAVQDKAWVEDPDGNDWEIFVVTDADAGAEANTHGDGACCATQSTGPCC